MSELTAPAPARVTDWVTMAGRCLRLTRRNPEAILTSLMLPVMLMLLFVYLFGGAINTGTAYVTYVVPGVLLLCAGFGSSITAQTVSHDMSSGAIDRFRSMDVSGSAVLVGHVVASVARNVASTALVLAVAYAIGFRPVAGADDWLLAVAVLLMFILAMSAVSAMVGLIARTPEGAGGFTFFVTFLPYPSSAFVPVDTMPSWIQGFAENQPVTPVIETLRSLLLTTPAGSNPVAAAAWCSGILVVSVLLARVLFRRRVS
ncbi:MAG: ABC transporter permease [Thermocrispum sp.]